MWRGGLGAGACITLSDQRRYGCGEDVQVRVVMVAGGGGSLIVVACTFHSAGTRTAAVGLSMNEGCGGGAPDSPSVCLLALCSCPLSHSLSGPMKHCLCPGWMCSCCSCLPQLPDDICCEPIPRELAAERSPQYLRCWCVRVHFGNRSVATRTKQTLSVFGLGVLIL